MVTDSLGVGWDTQSTEPGILITGPELSLGPLSWQKAGRPESQCHPVVETYEAWGFEEDRADEEDGPSRGGGVGEEGEKRDQQVNILGDSMIVMGVHSSQTPHSYCKWSSRFLGLASFTC